jgi:hypothetical protein
VSGGTRDIPSSVRSVALRPGENVWAAEEPHHQSAISRVNCGPPQITASAFASKSHIPVLEAMTMLPKAKADAYQRIETILDEGPFVPGTRGVYRAYFLYALRWSQAGARISEMNDLSWTITSLLLTESDWQSNVRTAYWQWRAASADAPPSAQRHAVSSDRRSSR